MRPDVTWPRNEEVRLPLLPVTPPTKAVIKNAMVHAGLLN